MRSKRLPPQPRILEVVRYIPETGQIFWENRTGRLSYLNGTEAGTKCWQLDGSPAGRLISIDGVRYKCSRIIWVLCHGHLPDGYVVDHINGDPWDDRIENLRLATESQNKANRRAYNISKTGIKGISPRKNGKFQVRIGHGGHRFQVGNFGSIEEAAEAFRSAEELLHGEFAFSKRPIKSR